LRTRGRAPGQAPPVSRRARRAYRRRGPWPHGRKTAVSFPPPSATARSVIAAVEMRCSGLASAGSVCCALASHPQLPPSWRAWPSLRRAAANSPSPKTLSAACALLRASFSTIW
jgi:hypothetical protein